MKKIISVICAVVLLVSSVSVSAFALTKEEADETLAAQNAIFKEIISERIDVNNSGKIEAADARLVLLCSAGLKNDGMNVANADIDKDGRVTAIDARIFLRLAAQLEKVENYVSLSNEEKFSYFLAIINSIKPGDYKFYRSDEEEMKKISYTDPDNLVGEMNRQLGLYADYDSEMADFDFGAEIKAAEGDISYGYSMAKTQLVSKYNYPVKSNELAFLATLDDVEKIEFQTNQSFKFERQSKPLGANAYTTVYEETVTGLDSITVYLKPESISLTGSLNDVFDNLKTGKAFDVLSEADIKKMLESNSSISGIEGMENLGTCDISISPKSLAYSGCYVTVYFYPETGIPVGTVHNLKYAMSMNLHMNIDISASSLAGDSLALQLLISILMAQNKGKLLALKGSMDITNEMNECTKYYFHNSNPAHIPY